MPKIQTILDNLARRNEPHLRVALKKWLNDTQKQIKADLTSKYQKSAASVTSTLTDWELITENGISTVKPAAMEVFKSGGNAAYRHLAILGSFDVVNIPAVKAVNKFCAKLVTDVTANTKKGIKTYIKHGIREGYSMPKIARELKPLVGLTGKQTQAVIHYRQLLQIRRPDLTAAQVDKAVMRKTNKTHRMRMENIARTETANAQNIGYCQGLGQVGIEEAELRNGSNPCDECIALDRTRYPIEEAEGIITVHPRCTCAMLPVLDDRAISERLREPPKELVGTGRIPADSPKLTYTGLKEKSISDEQISDLMEKFGDSPTEKQMEILLALTGEGTPHAFFTPAGELGSVISWERTAGKVYGRHLGSLVPKGGLRGMLAVTEEAIKTKSSLYLESTRDAIGFYRKLGYTETSTGIFDTKVPKLLGIRDNIVTKLNAVRKQKAATKIEPVDPPEEVVLLQRYPDGSITQKKAIEISKKLRRVYSRQLNMRAFGEMENAILTYDVTRVLAEVDNKIVGAISFHYDELLGVIYIDHIGTLKAPEGAGAELMRTAVDAAYSGGVGMFLESTQEAAGFYKRLGFEANTKVSYVFVADFNRVRQIKEALGSTGRVKEQTGE